MTDLDAAFIKFGELYPTPHAHPNGGDYDWEGDCAAFCDRFGKYTSAPFNTSGDTSSAWAVALASGPLDTDPAKAGPGSQHFWKQRSTSSGEPGHVATELSGHQLAMASAYCDSYLPNTVHLGYATVASYNARRGTVLKYMGHSTNYAGAHINATGTASSSENPIDNTPAKEDDMPAIEAVKMTEPGNVALFLIGEITCNLVSEYTASRYLRPGETYRDVDRPFITYHQQLVAQNRAAQALGPQMSPADFAKALAPLLPTGLTETDVQTAVEKAIAAGFVVTGTVKPA